MVSEKNPSVRVLVLITTEKSAKKAAEMFKAGGLPIQYSVLAEGTASSEIMDMLGLGSTEKRLLISVLPKYFADKMLQKLYEELKMNTVNSGIAFTIPLTGASSLFLRIITKDVDIPALSEDRKDTEKGEENIMNDKNYGLIVAVINRGFSNEVMVAAREAGAGGGTVVHSRQLINEETAGFWGISMQEEKEILLILSEAENKVKIMKAISEHCGIHSEVKGLVMSLPIDSVMGI